MVDRLILWIAREGWIGVVPMLAAAAWLAREAWAYRSHRRKSERMHDRYTEASAMYLKHLKERSDKWEQQQ